MSVRTDYLVLGSGIAGLSFALRAARHGQVILVTKRSVDESATNWAQGGVAAVIDPSDSFEKHAADTHFAGAGMCRSDAVDVCVRRAPESLKWLIDIGTQFTSRRPGELDLA